MRIYRDKIQKFLMLHIVFIIYSIISVIGKKASGYKFLSREFIILYLINIFIFMIYAILWQKVIKEIELSIAYANRGAIILWTMVWSVLLYNETITYNNLVGSFIIIIGIFMVVRDE